MKRFLVLIVCIINFNSFSQTKIEIGEKHTLFSTVLNENREYWVYLPPNYTDTIYAPEAYPVVYFLDGDRHFHSLTGIQDFLSVGPYASLPNMIYVGILTAENRSRDLTPTNVSKPQTDKGFVFPSTGGNDHFLEFMASELIPEINNKYRTNGYKTLIGHSFGGLTVFNILLVKPQLFNSYIAIDPSVWWDNDYILKKAKNELGTLNLKGIKMYLAQADNKQTPEDNNRSHENAIVSIKNELEKHRNNGLKWTYRFFDNDDHGTISLPSEYFGLRYIYDGYQIEMKMVANRPELLVEIFDDFSKTIGYNMKPEEARVDWIANYCLETDRPKQAVEFFELNQKYYPDSINTYIVLGDYYAKISDFDKAKKEYRKALKLDAKSPLVIKKLEEFNK